jgi:hypothetical protein
MEIETLRKLVEMAGTGSPPDEIATTLNLTLTPEFLALIHEVRQRAFELIPVPTEAQVRRQMWLNRFSTPRGCDPFR